MQRKIFFKIKNEKRFFVIVKTKNKKAKQKMIIKFIETNFRKGLKF